MLRDSKCYFLFFLLMLSFNATASDDEKYATTIDHFKSTDVGRQLFKSAHAYAVFPLIAKAGLGLGGAHGKGRVYQQGALVGKVSMTQLSIGFQAGGQAYEQIVFLQDARAFAEFTSGSFEFDAGASVIAVHASAEAKVGTSGHRAGAGMNQEESKQAETVYHKGMAVLVIGKGGLMYEASVSGQNYKYSPF